LDEPLAAHAGIKKNTYWQCKGAPNGQMTNELPLCIGWPAEVARVRVLKGAHADAAFRARPLLFLYLFFVGSTFSSLV
jgi:hypothetical protein